MTIFGIPIFPDQASSFAKDVDALYFFILATCAFFTIVVSAAVVYLGIKYHKTHEGQIGARIEGNLPLELLWSVIPTMIAMVMFAWGASVYYHLRTPPDEALHLYAVGKQWMWKFQHLEGQREINELHLPAGRPVKITISSEDVLHSLYFPAFRTKMDAIPGRYTELWFEPQQAGVYHIFCAEYCGTNHAGMIGSVTVLEPAAYQSWLQGGGAEGTLAQRGVEAVQRPGVLDLPPRYRPGPRPVAEGHHRQDRGAAGRLDGGRRRGLPARIDPDIAGEDREGLPAVDADVPGTGQRRKPRRLDRTREIMSPNATTAASADARVGQQRAGRFEGARKPGKKK